MMNTCKTIKVVKLTSIRHLKNEFFGIEERKKKVIWRENKMFNVAVLSVVYKVY